MREQRRENGANGAGGADATASKQALRARFLARRAALPPDVRADQSRGLCGHLGALAGALAAHTVHAYPSDAARAEPDLMPLLARWHASGIDVVLPRVVSRRPPDLSHHVWDGRPLASGAYSLPEPAATLPLADLSRLDLVLVPALSADPTGVRLGYGGGFYDAFLNRLAPGRERPVVVCALFADLVHESLPREPHDVAVDALVTEQGVTWTRSGPPPGLAAGSGVGARRADGATRP